MIYPVFKTALADSIDYDWKLWSFATKRFVLPIASSKSVKSAESAVPISEFRLKAPKGRKFRLLCAYLSGYGLKPWAEDRGSPGNHTEPCIKSGELA